jgi:hypothetical protein
LPHDALDWTSIPTTHTETPSKELDARVAEQKARALADLDELRKVNEIERMKKGGWSARLSGGKRHPVNQTLSRTGQPVVREGDVPAGSAGVPALPGRHSPEQAYESPEDLERGVKAADPDWGIEDVYPAFQPDTSERDSLQPPDDWRPEYAAPSSFTRVMYQGGLHYMFGGTLLLVAAAAAAYHAFPDAFSHGDAAERHQNSIAFLAPLRDGDATPEEQYRRAQLDERLEIDPAQASRGIGERIQAARAASAAAQ